MLKKKILIWFVCLLAVVYTWLETDYEALGVFYFYALGLYVAIDLILIRRIHLLHVWQLAFNFIFLSEINTDSSLYFLDNILFTVQFLCTANILIILGYYTYSPKAKAKVKDKESTVNRLRRSTLIFLICLMLVYVGYTLPFAIKSFLFGRDFAMTDSSGGFVGSIIGALAHILPAAFAYYFMQLKTPRMINAIIFSLPIWVLLFMIGTRFPLLFSVMGLVIVVLSLRQTKLTTKNYVYLFLAMGVLYGSSIFMKQLRSNFRDPTTVISIDENEMRLPRIAGNFGSNERVVEISSKLFTYYEHPDNKHQLGMGYAFILYFWVPRSVWPDKPTMAGHWFVRKIRVVSENYSAALGFTGQFYIDFGYYGLIFIFLLGMLLRRGEFFFETYKRSKSFDLVVGAMFYPVIFFFVRSPLTALISFAGIFFFYFLIKKFFVKKYTADTVMLE